MLFPSRFYIMRAMRRRIVDKVRCPVCRNKPHLQEQQSCGLRVEQGDVVPGDMKFGCPSCGVNFKISNPSVIPGYEVKG